MLQGTRRHARRVCTGALTLRRIADDLNRVSDKSVAEPCFALHRVADHQRPKELVRVNVAGRIAPGGGATVEEVVSAPTEFCIQPVEPHDVGEGRVTREVSDDVVTCNFDVG